MTSVAPSQPLADPDLMLLAAISATLMADYIKPETDPWIGSPFAWIKTRPSRQVGSIGEQLVAGWCAAKGLDVIRTGVSPAMAPYPEIEALVADGAALPIVVLDGVVRFTGGKLQLSAIEREVAERLATAVPVSPAKERVS
jgi:hypothetical protein